MAKKLIIMIAVVLAALIAAGPAAHAQAPVSERWLTGGWDAEWCSHPDGPGHDPAVFLFRREFDLKEKPDRFVIHVSADQRYRLYVNGESVAAGPARGDLLHWRYESIDIAPYLEAGKNLLAARVWSDGILAPWAQFTAHTAFIVQGDSAPGSTANTCFGWKVFRDESRSVLPKQGVKPSGCVAGANEVIDATLHPWGWLETDFDDSSWARPIAIAGGVPAGLRGDGSSLWFLVPRNIPMMAEKPARIPRIARAKKIRPTEGFLKGSEPFEIPASSKTTILLDNVVLTNAYPEMTVSGGAGARIKLSYEESLFKYPEVALDRLIKGDRNDIKKCAIRENYRYDEFLPDGGAARVFSPLWWRTFRFIQMDIQTGVAPLVIDNLRIIETGYPFETRAKFESGDPLLAKIWEVGDRTARLCAGETYFDCPFYEQLQYAGDTRIQMQLSYYVYGDDALARNAIELLDNSRIPEGLTMSRYSTRMHQVIPPFSLQWIGMIYEHWYYYGDGGFTAGFLAGIEGVLGWFEARRLDNGLLGDLPWWNFVDWTWPGGVPPGAGAEGSSIISLEYALALRQAAELEEQLGRADLAARFSAQADGIVSAVTSLCWDESRGLMADSLQMSSFSQHATILAVLADAIPDGGNKTAMENALADTTITQTTLQFKYFLHKAVDKAGLGDRYLLMLGPWKEMLDVGLTTWPETGAESRSDCHAWSASPSFELLSIVAGIKPGSPGFDSVRIEPHPGGLEWLKAEVPHRKGPVRAAYKIENGSLTAEIELPAGLSGIFIWKNKEYPIGPGAQTIKP